MDDSRDSDYFIAFNVPSDAMDRLWEEGWRHFGWYFFRYRTSSHAGKRYHVIPLRIDLGRFVVSKSKKRVLARNRDVETIVRPSRIDGEREALFAKHALRFGDAPPSLRHFVSPMPATVPCTNREVALYIGKKLAGVTYLDIGSRATSAVYAIYDTDETARSLGIFMTLESIRYSISLGCRYYYQGYAYREPFAYDYKKRFAGTERLEWDEGWTELGPSPIASE